MMAENYLSPKDFWGPYNTLYWARYPTDCPSDGVEECKRERSQCPSIETFPVDCPGPLFIETGNGPYLGLIPEIDFWKNYDSTCDCGLSHESMVEGWDNIIVERAYHECIPGDYDGSWDVIVRCPKCSKIWRDIQ